MSEPLDLEPIKARLSSALPGPWKVRNTGISNTTHLVVMPQASVKCGREGEDSYYDCRGHASATLWIKPENADLIAAAPTDIAALVVEVERLREALKRIGDYLDGQPEYHHQGMGCGLEDRCITDRYEAMEHGWDSAVERVYGEHINDALEIARSALGQVDGHSP